MDQDAVMATLSDLIQDVFNDPDLAIGPTTSAADIAGWDSMTHITLIVAIEQAFGIRFRTSEMDGLHDVGELAALVVAKRAVAAV
jgi:acyl carrier protein